MPNKALGQHWLKNREILEQIADLAITEMDGEIPQAQTCVEIGPGLGFLTSSLLRRFPEVVAVEFDADLAAKLPQSFPGKNLQVVAQDILKFDFSSVKPPFVAAGNIPYYLTSPLIRKLLTLDPAPERVVLLIQKEVAERVAATPGKHTFLSLFAQNYTSVTLGPVVPRAEFTPPPKVDSQVVVLQPHPAIVEPQVLDLVKIGFSNPRKKLVANLAVGLHLSKEQIKAIFSQLSLNLDARPADLNLIDWQKLHKALVKIKHKR